MKEKLQWLEKKPFDFSWIKSLIVLSIFMIFHANSQIREHDIETWLPFWVNTAKNWFGLPEAYPFKIIDGYHIFKGLGFIIIGYYFKSTSNWKYEIVKWVIAWLVFDLFYHVIFIKF
ncbi:MAG: hypothetical protein OEM46_00705 [Ignavibacteria bacterium]|nr:hypothetical protein [Ignavibacteria bacterium]